MQGYCLFSEIPFSCLLHNTLELKKVYSQIEGIPLNPKMMAEESTIRTPKTASLTLHYDHFY